MDAINLNDKFSLFSEQWTPKVIAELNGQAVKIAKIQGEFVWHHHENEDELFFVVKGRLRMEFRDKTVWLEPGEILVIPRGVEHRPCTEEETWIMMFEPTTTLNTGNVENERTVAAPERV